MAGIPKKTSATEASAEAITKTTTRATVEATIETAIEAIEGFELPTYREIPDVGLFLEQVTKYVGGYLQPLDGASLTGSMISNYVKKGILKNPVKKQYDRERIAYLFFIAVAKSVLSLEDVELLVRLLERTAPCEAIYGAFRENLRRELLRTFGTATDDERDEASKNATAAPTNDDGWTLLHATVVAVAHKVYLGKRIEQIRAAGI